MKDFSFWEKYDGASEGSGRSEKIWLLNPDTDQIGLFKFKKDIYTTDHVSECIAYELAKLLDIPCAKFELGTYQGREGSMSYNIVDREGAILIEGIYCISAIYNFDAERLIDVETGEKYSLEMIRKVLEPLELFDSFLPLLVFDFLIGNTDRHQSNWALILENGKLSLSPLYDNSSSLCAYVKEDRIKQYLGKDMLLWKSLVDTKSRSIIRITGHDKKAPTHLEMLKFLKKQYYRETKDVVKTMEERIFEEAVCRILDKYKESLSEEKRALIKKYILAKVELLKNVYKKEV